MAIQDQVKRSLEKHNLNFRSIVTYLIFGSIVLVFVLFNFPGQRLGAGHRGIAAQVDSQIISLSDFREESQRLEKMYSQFMGGSFDATSQRSFIRGRALENLIMSELLFINARKAGIYCSDEEVKDYLVEDIPAFQDAGQFDRSKYFQYLEAVKMSPEELENKLRKEKTFQRVHRLFSTAPVLEKETAWLKDLSETKMNVSYVKIDLELLKKQFQVSDKDVKEFLAQSDAQQKIETEFNLHKNDTYSQKEEVHAQHILIKAKEGDAASEKAALEKATAIKEKAQKGDFAALAKANSEDEGSKMNGGDLGFFAKGQMVPPFEAAAFKASAGEIVGPVKTSFGYHIIKVLAHKDAKEQKLEDVKSEIAKKLVADKNSDQFFKKLEEMLNNKKTAEVDQELKSKNLVKEETGLFSLNDDQIPKIGGSENLKEAISGLQKIGEWSTQVVREGNFRYLVQLKEVKKDTDVAAAKKPDIWKQKIESRTQQFVDQWVDQTKKESKIYRNIDAIEQ